MGTAVILPDFVLSSRVNQCWKYAGLDSLEQCVNKQHFKQYPHHVNYQYNSRGFRDAEWPNSMEELQQAVWCVGDSFTVGLGSPINHTWPWLLQKESGLRTINISLDGASNNWIARKVIDILQIVQPKCIIIHWSYFNRRELSDTSLIDEDRRLQYLIDELELEHSLNNFQSCVDQISRYNNHSKIMHSIIPKGHLVAGNKEVQQVWTTWAGVDWPQQVPECLEDIPNFIIEEIKTLHGNWNLIADYFYVNNRLKNIMHNATYLGCIEQLDFARDGHHYDLLTAESFVRNIIQHWG